jgi:hypothetical protein
MCDIAKTGKESANEKGRPNIAAGTAFFKTGIYGLS